QAGRRDKLRGAVWLARRFLATTPVPRGPTPRGRNDTSNGTSGTNSKPAKLQTEGGVMLRALKERVDSREAKREPPYRTTMEPTPEQQKALAEKLGGIQNYNPVLLRELARKDRRSLAPLSMPILSAAV